MTITKERDLEDMRAACRVARLVLDEVSDFIQPGRSTREVDLYAAERMKAHGARSAFLNYRNYPCHACISVNDQIVHGVASERRLEFGDIVSLDVGIYYRGFVGDNARTVAVGGCGIEAQRLMDVTERALYEGIAQARPGKRVTDISRAIQNYVEGNGYSVVREYVGHGVGRAVHEDPQIPNYVDSKCNQKLHAGMTIAIEPMVNAGKPDTRTLGDEWTVVTADGSLSAHFEHTVMVTKTEPEILTVAPKESLKS
jgi:methionyl aminopeptidase